MIQQKTAPAAYKIYKTKTSKISTIACIINKKKKISHSIIKLDLHSFVLIFLLVKILETISQWLNVDICKIYVKNCHRFGNFVCIPCWLSLQFGFWYVAVIQSKCLRLLDMKQTNISVALWILQRDYIIVKTVMSRFFYKN